MIDILVAVICGGIVIAALITLNLDRIKEWRDKRRHPDE